MYSILWIETLGVCPLYVWQILQTFLFMTLVLHSIVGVPNHIKCQFLHDVALK